MPGKRIGYIRVSTLDQNPDRQLVDIELDKKFIEFASAKDTNRPQLQQLLDYIREDDELFVHSIDRLARSVQDLHNLVDMLVKKGIVIHFVKQNLTFNGNDSHFSKFQLAVLGGVAELERGIILERQREGIAEAKKKGKFKGGKKKLDAAKIEILKAKMQTRDSKSKIAFDLGISRETLYRYLKNLGITSQPIEDNGQRISLHGKDNSNRADTQC